MVRQLEHRNDDLVSRLEFVQAESSSEKECSKNRLTELCEENTRLKQSLSEMDAHRDSIENQLDQLTVSKLSKPQMEKICRENKELQKSLTEIRSVLHNAQVENSELQMVVQSQAQYLRTAEGDMKALAREAQASHSETNLVQEELNNLKNSLREKAARLDHAEHAHKVLTLEKEDLEHHYRDMLGERTLLEETLQQISHDRAHLLEKVACMSDANRSLSTQLQDMHAELEKRVHDFMAYQQQTSVLTHHHEAAQRALEALESENSRLRLSIKHSQQSFHNISSQSNHLQQRTARAVQHADGLQGVMQALEKEREALQSLLSQERMRGKEMEGLVATARAKDAAAMEQIKNLARENARWKTKWNEVKVRLDLNHNCMIANNDFLEMFEIGTNADDRNGVTPSTPSRSTGHQYGDNEEVPKLADYLPIK